MAVKIVATHERHGFSLTINVDDSSGHDRAYAEAAAHIVAEMTMAVQGVPGEFVAGTLLAQRWLLRTDVTVSYRLRRPWQFRGWLVTVTATD